MDQQFPKSEKLKSQEAIRNLFARGSSSKVYPLVVRYHLANASEKRNQAAFSVSKKRIKKAVDRNLLKRRMREAYRLHKHTLAQEQKTGYHMLFIYLPGEVLPYSAIEKAMKSLLPKIDNQT